MCNETAFPGLIFEHCILLNTYNLVTVNVCFHAYADPTLREFIGKNLFSFNYEA